ncbi:MAG: chromosome segregation protein SMC [Syntrophobacteria bacterium]
MHIKQLELFGFKSFVDKATVTFSTGICAVVGPNGCGKSNIVDAIRWVLGEQSAKQLRGKLMEEVIFGGANGRPSLNFTEVSLVLSNEDGKAPPPYHEHTEIMVTRRLFRSGESEYLINKIPCRRMDISRMFMDVGVGHRHYAIIEQGKISTVVESKPEDIRALIEEAAGITKFKIKKKAALRKIELTRQNLLRLGDIIAEVSRHLSSLKRQAQRANRYRTLKKEIKQIEITRALHRYGQYNHDLQRLEQDLSSFNDRQAERAAKLGKLDAELTDRSTQMHEIGENLRQRREALFQIKNSISSDENSLLHLQRQSQELKERQQRLTKEIEQQEDRRKHLAAERDRLTEKQRDLAEECSKAEVLAHKLEEKLNREKSRLNQLTDELDLGKGELVDLLGEMAQVRNAQMSMRKHLEDLDRRQSRRKSEYQELKEKHDRLQPLRESLESKKTAMERKLDELSAQADSLNKKKQELDQARDECTEVINSLESTYHQQHSQLQVLVEMESSYAWFSDAVRELMNARDEDELKCNIRGAVAEILEVDASHRQAVEAVLGGRLQALVVDSVGDACAALEHLKRTGTGRNHFIPLSVTNQNTKHAPSGDGPVPLAGLVRPRPGYEQVVNHLLSKVMFCDDLKQALSWWQSHPNAFALVTPEGDLVAQDGTLWGGSPEQQISILEKQEQRKDLEEKVSKSESRLSTERSKFREIEEQLAQTASELQSIQEDKQKRRDQILEQEKEHYRLETEEQRITERLAMLDMEKDHEEEEVSHLHVELSQSEQELESLEKRRQELDEDLAETRHERQELEGTVDNLQEKTTAQQVSVGALTEKQEAARSSYKQLEEYYAETQRRLEQLREERKNCQQQIELLSEERVQIQERLELAQKQLLEREESLRAEEDEWRKFEDHQHHLESRRLQLIREDREKEQGIQNLRQEITELKLKIQYLVHQIQEHYHMDITAEPPPDLEEPVDLEKLESKLQRLRDRVARIGEVNLTAIEEYEEQHQRHQFLTGQRDDLVQSLEGLNKAISRINRTTRNRFLKTLEAVNRKLAEVFPLLFNGGTGHLQLSSDRDPLEAGVEIFVHPPGKKLTSMSLLSGGEKALAAGALLFSLYMIKPSPFCILDEVDAPLDDANIDRFIEVLKKISQESQIILVTHNKRTMEISDILLGVTMEEPGISKIISVDFQGIPESYGQMVQ